MDSKRKIIFGTDKIIDVDTSQQDLLTLLLKNRNIKKEDLPEFLNPTHPDHINADKYGIWLTELSKAVARIRIAIENKENILIYGDYDVDGITSTAILWQALNKSKALVTPFVPDRESDGYGFKYDSFIRFQAEKKIKFNLLITVDNGIVATSELQKVKDDGVEIIIVDHHLADENSNPPAFAIVHSTQVSGSVLSWILASKFYKDADLGLAALGAVADCVPLLGVNRNIVVHGLKRLQTSPGHGIKKLMEISGSKQETLSTYDLGYILGPRINAVGRLSNPTQALRLLCAPTAELAISYAKTLDDYNKDRQTLQKECIDFSEKCIIKNESQTPLDKLIFVSHTDFHPGIIGLIAGRLTEKYYLPSIAISMGSTVSKGSCRSIKEINIIETLREFSHLLVDVGGHAGAAGFSIKNENIPEFQKQIIDFVNEKLKDIELSPVYFVDAQAMLSAVSVKNHKVIKNLEPFGMENLEPFFLFKDLTISYKKVVGQTGDHLKLKFDDLENAISVDAIAFKKGEMDSILNIGDKVDLIARIDTNVWNNVTSPQLIVKEIIIKQ